MMKPKIAPTRRLDQEDQPESENDMSQLTADAESNDSSRPSDAVSFISRRHAPDEGLLSAQEGSGSEYEPAKSPTKSGGRNAKRKRRKGKNKNLHADQVNHPIKSAVQASVEPEIQAPPAPELTMELRSIASPSKLKKRHWGLISSFLLVALVPWVAVVAYLTLVAEDQYHSVAGFTVRSQEQSGASELLGSLGNFVGGDTASDSDILYEFIQSQEMVQTIDAQIDLRNHFAQNWPSDWVFSIWPEATQEDLIWYWNRMIGVSYDSSTGLIEVQAKAFDPEMAQNIASAIVAVSQARINDLNLQAREDAMRYAQADLDDAIEVLKTAREAMTNFRTTSQIVDPETDIQTRMGVMTSLQQELATALVEYDLLRGTTTQADPRLKEATQRIEVIRDRIAIERRNFATSSTETGGVNRDYPSLIAEFERLSVDREYAEQTYFASLTALEVARDEANRQSRYLATYINPTLAESPEFPQRFFLAGLIGLFLLLTWSIMALVYYSIRDRA